MKTASITAVLFIAALSVGTLAAQTPMSVKKVYDSRADLGRKNYLMALRSGNDGATESSLAHIMLIRMNHPDLEMDQLYLAIDSLIKYSNSPSIRYKALLASEVCENPDWFAECRHLTAADTDQFYLQIAQRLHQRIFAHENF